MEEGEGVKVVASATGTQRRVCFLVYSRYNNFCDVLTGTTMKLCMSSRLYNTGLMFSFTCLTEWD